MSTSYEAKRTLVKGAQLDVQELVLGYTIVGNATPASVVVSVANPGVLYIQTESTSASGSTNIATLITSGDTYTPTNAPDDSDGEYNVLVHIGEALRKVVSVEARDRKTGAVIPTTFQTAPASGFLDLTDSDDPKFPLRDTDHAIVFGVDHGADLTAATVDAVLIVRYIAE